MNDRIDSYQTLKIENITGGIYELSFDVPSKLNAITPQLQHDLVSAMKVIQQLEELKVLIISGNGRAFCAGGDINSLKDSENQDYLENRGVIEKHHQWFKVLASFDRPVVAKLHGAVMGGGMSIAMASDYCIAESETKFGLPFIKLGLAPDLASMFYLPRIVGLAQAKEMCMFGDAFDSEKALSSGLINEIAVSENIEERCIEIAKRFEKLPYYAFNFIKNTINKSFENSIEEMYEKESFMQPALKTTNEFKSLVNSFFDKK